MGHKGNGIIVDLGYAITKDNIDKALRKFKNKIKKANLMVELYERQAYKKPSLVKREKMLKAKGRKLHPVEIEE